MSPILSVRNLSRNFGAIKAVDDVSFDLAKGELLALIGPNGAGKSTCFNMLMGQLKPSSGTVQLMGKNIAGMQPRKIWRMGVGRTFQITATYASMTVVENVQMALMSHHKRLYSLTTFAHKLYREEALALLDTADRRYTRATGHQRVVYRTRHGRGLCPFAPHHGAEPWPADRRRHRRRDPQQPAGARGLSGRRHAVQSAGGCPCLR